MHKICMTIKDFAILRNIQWFLEFSTNELDVFHINLRNKY